VSSARAMSGAAGRARRRARIVRRMRDIGEAPLDDTRSGAGWYEDFEFSRSAAEIA
jgi:hypothetical protein